MYTVRRPRSYFTRKHALGKVGARLRIIDSNKIKKAHQLPSFLRLGPGPRRAFALGVAHGVAWLQRLRWRWRDPGGVHKRHLHLDAPTAPNPSHPTPPPPHTTQATATHTPPPPPPSHSPPDR